MYFEKEKHFFAFRTSSTHQNVLICGQTSNFMPHTVFLHQQMISVQYSVAIATPTGTDSSQLPLN